MDFEVKDALQVVGQNAGVVFAAWIFMSFLQQRYVAALDRYRQLVNDYRAGNRSEARRPALRDQVMAYRRRVHEMRLATNLGIYSAWQLLASLIVGLLSTVFGDNALFRALAVVLPAGGLITVMVAAGLVVRENVEIKKELDEEPLDVPDLARDIDSRRGSSQSAPPGGA
jgi:hypothetical protein